jgi:hypothetical protein
VIDLYYGDSVLNLLILIQDVASGDGLISESIASILTTDLALSCKGKGEGC